MRSINRVVISAALGVALFGTPVCAAENLQLAGLWKLVAFHTEDVVTKERGAYYGEQPMGFMKLETNGKLSAWMASGWAETPAYRAVFYSGRYRLDPDTFLVRIERAEHEGFVGAAPFDLTWNEGVTRTEEARRFYSETDSNEREVLVIESVPMANPNGAGNTIVGLQAWVKVSDWEFGQ